MRLLNQRYVNAFNRSHRRTGALWDSGFRSCLVDSEHYALAVYRYIELNPVRAAMVERPEHYPWSSARENLRLCPQTRLNAHPVYLALGVDAPERARAWRELLCSGLIDEDLDAIRSHIRQQRTRQSTLPGHGSQNPQSTGCREAPRAASK